MTKGINWTWMLIPCISALSTISSFSQSNAEAIQEALNGNRLKLVFNANFGVSRNYERLDIHFCPGGRYWANFHRESGLETTYNDYSGNVRYFDGIEQGDYKIAPYVYNGTTFYKLVLEADISPYLAQQGYRSAPREHSLWVRDGTIVISKNGVDAIITPLGRSSCN